ncbi:hypothetical protein OG21DRAFT_679501 [Imleria badia]|nr:hypothetical protein OG21DRAFT_679501 [Imleria badia]
MSLTVSEVAGLQTSKYFNGVSFFCSNYVMLIVWRISRWHGDSGELYDYVITLEEEARWVWGRSWDATRFIFTVLRYLPFVGMVITVYGEHATRIHI